MSDVGRLCDEGKRTQVNGQTIGSPIEKMGTGNPHVGPGVYIEKKEVTKSTYILLVS